MEVTGTQEAIEIADPSAVGEVRRRAAALAVHAGLDEARAGDVALIATEAASNVVKHAVHGGVLLAGIEVDGVGGVSIAAWDRGPGMDVARCLKDGMSTAGTAGAGLGAISRLATRWDAYSRAGLGTVLTAKVLPRGYRTAPGSVDVAGVSVPIRGEIECGDGWDAHVHADGSISVIVCDGLGHGPLAASATKVVLAAFQHQPEDSPAGVLVRADRAARATRGAAGAVVRIDSVQRSAILAGVGNIAGFVWGDGRMRPMVSQHGTLGHAMPQLREERYLVPQPGTIILCSDGLKTRLDLTEHHGLERHAAATIAAVLWRDFARGRDDATAVVIRLEPQS